MSNLLIFWLSTGVFFLMIEMFTATLYGLSVSLSAFLLAIYVYFTGETNVGVAQAMIFVVTGAIFCYFFPKWFQSKSSPQLKIGLEKDIGETFVLKASKGDYKIVVDGVDYLVDDRCVTQEFASGKKVVLNGMKNGLVEVTLL